MKKISIICLCLSLLAPAMAAEFRWADVYKAGPVKLIPDPAFGKGVDWGSFLFESFKDLAVADDGTIFMANSRENTIHKFDPSGKKVLTFGQKGQGPGDLESPNCPSVLDGKYLVVGEYATNRRISLFGLDGRFHKLLKAERPVYDVAALGGTKIAYVSRQFEQGDTGQKTAGVMLTPMTIRVVLKDIETGAEQVILTRTVQQKFIQINRGPTISFGDNMTGGGLFLARTSDGRLAVAVANSPQIEIFDGGGRRVGSFAIAKTAQPATSDFIARYKNNQVEGMRKQWAKIPTLLNALKDIEGYDFSQFFDEPLPIFTDMTTDADGNFLFFLRPENPGEPGLEFCAYSPGGELIAETRLDPGLFKVSLDQRFRCLRFAKAGLIGLAPLKADADELPVLFRVVPNMPRS
jgi:hypothetical protein